MKIAAIIAEYNPFHNGHKFQIEKIHEILGNDISIVAIMSGNFLQRGDLAIADKTVRAKMAVMCGVNLVLELPFPFSSSSAEFFARSGVKIATEIGADYLVFGSESGDIEAIIKAADIMSSDRFAEEFEKIRKSKSYSSTGYPTALKAAYDNINRDTSNFNILAPNNILAIEYIKAIKYFNSSIMPITIKREGAGYSEDNIMQGTNMQSATAIRNLIPDDIISAFKYMPNEANNVFFDESNRNLMLSDISRLNSAIISDFRLQNKKHIEIHDAEDGLYNRLSAISMNINSISSLTALAETKKYTRSRIKRAIINSFFGVTSSMVKEYPKFTQVLAMDDIGRHTLKRIKKTTAFPCVTKPSDFKHLPDEIIAQKVFANKSDAIYALTLPGNVPGTFPLTFTPFVKK